MTRAPAILTLSCLLGACSPGSLAVPAETPALTVASSLSIGPVALDSTGSASLTVQNAGDIGLSLRGVIAGAEFSFADGGVESRWTLDTGASREIQVLFRPVDGADADGLLTLIPDPSQLFGSQRADVPVTLTGLVNPDGDGDGHLHPDAGGDDCDDQDSATNPDADEIWYDGTDQDCDGRDDDQDQDGYDRLSDCDDQDADRSPAASDDDLDGVDDDCDGLVDQDAIRALSGALIFSEHLSESVVATGRAAQWLELANVSGERLSIAGFRLGDAELAGTISGPDSLDADGYLVLCAETDPALNGGVACDGSVSPWPDLPLGELTLYAPILSDRGVEEERVTLDELILDERWPTVAGYSTQLDAGARDAASNDDPARWCLSAGSATEADNATPGAANTAC